MLMDAVSRQLEANFLPVIMQRQADAGDMGHGVTQCVCVQSAAAADTTAVLTMALAGTGVLRRRSCVERGSAVSVAKKRNRVVRDCESVCFLRTHLPSESVKKEERLVLFSSCSLLSPLLYSCSELFFLRSFALHASRSTTCSSPAITSCGHHLCSASCSPVPRLPLSARTTLSSSPAPFVAPQLEHDERDFLLLLLANSRSGRMRSATGASRRLCNDVPAAGSGATPVETDNNDPWSGERSPPPL